MTNFNDNYLINNSFDIMSAIINYCVYHSTMQRRIILYLRAETLCLGDGIHFCAGRRARFRKAGAETRRNRRY